MNCSAATAAICMPRSCCARYRDTAASAATVRSAIRAVPVARWNAMFSKAGPVLPQRLRVADPGRKIHRLANVIGNASLQHVYERLVSLWPEPA